VSYPPPSPPSGQPGWQPPPQQGGWQPPPQQGGWGPPPQPGYGGGGGFGGGGFGGPQGPLAGWPLRVGAYLLAVAPALVLAAINFAIDSVALGFLISLVNFAYGLWLAYEDGAKGQNWAKKIVGIKLIKEQTGQVIGGGAGIGRSFLHIIDILPCCFPLGFAWPIWDNKKQTFADKIMGTVVIQVPKG
jgi:uncharacterized RDD family membrane protein YckC